MPENNQLKNLLIQYQGGGYDGCMWEWNFFYLDKGGNFHDIYSSGRAAITTLDEALNLLQSDDTFYVYDPACPTSVDEFAKETHPALVKLVVQWFDTNANNEFYAICSECSCKIFDPDEIYLENETIICDECYGSGSCSYCGEYYGQESDGLIFSVKDIEKQWNVPAKIAQSIIDNYAPICCDCCEKLLNKALDQIIMEQKNESNKSTTAI